ncbi:MAG: biotin attachment protein [Flavobacteriaceae bacterium]|nr:MAG: biotin attachment protein [Flavobacteriaceae bacterium]
MLKITHNTISEYLSNRTFSSIEKIQKENNNKKYLLLLSFLLLLFIVVQFLPWTQNIQAKGEIVSRFPDQGPQTVQTIIGGRIEKWYVKEGDQIKKGDTLVFLSEVKSEYFDPNLIQRTQEQLNAKDLSIGAYENKVSAIENQARALEQALIIKKNQTQNKLVQAKNKIEIENAELQNINKNNQIAQNQYQRIRSLYQKGLKTLSELQEKELKYQETLAKVSIQQNKLNNAQNEYYNLELELSAIERDYSEKIAKANSDKQSALSQSLEGRAESAKLRSSVSNYSQRQKMYYVTAPQDGYVSSLISTGIGQTLKEGEEIARIVPDKNNIVAQFKLSPQDIPLVSKEGKVRMRFDGWPSLVISGWPETSTGVFEGHVIAIDQFLTSDGYYRVLVQPNDKYKPWPIELRMGTGTQGFFLLKTVPVWYEIWRQLNGFPADYYREDSPETKKK